MRIDTSRSSEKQSHASGIWQNGIFMAVLGSLALSLVSFGFGVYSHRSGLVGQVGQSLGVMKQQHVHLLPKFTAGVLSEPKHLSINIKFKNFQKLSDARDKALESKALVVTGDDFVSASIDFDGELIPVKLRLKGDHIDHLQGDKWSFRVRVKGDGNLFGMKQFSLHTPQTRNYVSEWLYHEALRREDVLSLRYEFVSVSVNGKELGIYALEEHFEKRLVENRRRREGPIIKFDEAPAWDEFIAQSQYKRARKNGVGSLSVAAVDSFETSRWLETEESRRLHDRAASMLETFRRGEASTSEVFDVERLASYFALTELVGAQHGARWINTRYYYNPITARLEPIGFDGNAGKEIQSLCYFQRPGWSHSEEQSAVFAAGLSYYELIFRDPIFVSQYLKKLAEVSQEDYVDRLIDETQETLVNHLGVIYKEFPGYQYSPDVFYRNARYIRSVIFPNRAVVAFQPDAVSGEVASVSVSNVQGFPVAVIGASLNGKRLDIEPSELELPGKKPLECASYSELVVAIPTDVQPSSEQAESLRLLVRVDGTGEQLESEVSNWSAVTDRSIREDLVRRTANDESFDFVLRDEDKKEIYFRRGDWTISKDLVLPAGYRVRCDRGTKLHLIDSALILSHSPFTFAGTEDEPILIDSPDKTGQGVVVMGAPGDSTLDHVSFVDLTAPARPSWSLTGAVSFYESNVFISNCQFVNVSCEDALNIIRSKFSLKDSLVANTAFDALDCDFCTGRIQDCQFKSCGNDGIDISGSDVTVEDVNLNQVGDKAISIGENSSMVAARVTIDDANVGIACKDLSQLAGEDLNIVKATVGFTAFQKKPEFGGGTIRVTNVSMGDVENRFLIEHNSSVVVDKKTIPPNRKKLKEELY